MKSNSPSTAERRLSSCLPLAAATGALAAQRCCCASPTAPTQLCCSLCPTWNTGGNTERAESKNCPGNVQWCCLESREPGFPSHAEKGQRVLFSYLGEVQCSWPGTRFLPMPSEKEEGLCFIFNLGAVRGKRCWHWGFVLLGFCSVLQIRLLFPWSLCRNGKHAWAFKHTLKSIKTVLKYISLL